MSAQSNNLVFRQAQGSSAKSQSPSNSSQFHSLMYVGSMLPTCFLMDLQNPTINDIFMSSGKTPFSILLNIVQKLYFVLEFVRSWKGLRV